MTGPAGRPRRRTRWRCANWWAPQKENAARKGPGLRDCKSGAPKGMRGRWMYPINGDAIRVAATSSN